MIDYRGIIEYFKQNIEISYSNPDDTRIELSEKRRLSELKSKGENTVKELRGMADSLSALYGLDKCLPITWLDASNKKTKKYLSVRMKYSLYKDSPISITVFLERTGQEIFVFRTSLEIDGDGVDKGTMEKYHTHLDMPIDLDSGLVYVAGSNMWGRPEAIDDNSETIKERLKKGELRKVQISKYIEQREDDTNESIHNKIVDAVGKLLPYYNYVLGIDGFWPSEKEYTVDITKEEWKHFIEKEEFPNHKGCMRVFKCFMEMDGIASSKQLAERFGGHPTTYMGSVLNTCRRAIKFFDMAPCQDGNEQRYFPIGFQGKGDKESGNYLYRMRKTLYEALLEIDLSQIDCEEGGENSVKEFDKNIILYGPPGTGKTYNTAIYAVAICDGRGISELTDYDEVMTRYNELKAERRVAFTTFHQSYGYEEFIEGIKPVVDDASKDVSYTIESGVFKKFCETAKVVQEDEVEYTGTVWTVRNRTGDKNVPTDYEQRLYEEGTIKIEDINDHNRQCGLLNDMVPGDWIVFGRNYDINAIGVVVDDAPEEIEDGIFHYQRRVEWKATGLKADCKAINRGKCFSNFALAQSWMKVQDLQKIIDGDTKNEQPYVFIVDEINRGNISKIFGELITLIENTKREGMPEAASAILPYSGESFSVPSNVYILGTMNTADRSIALMDTALRRRFQFEEMMPDADVLRAIGADKVNASGVELDVAAMLETINERISFLYDREHTIGHAFFTGLKNDSSVEKLASIFAKSVIPLLQEYFYEDYQKIQLVLGDNGKADESHKFIKDIKVVAKNIFKGSVDDVVDLPEKKYEVNDDALMNIQSYIEIM